MELPTVVVAFLDEMKVPGVLSTLAPGVGPVTSAVWFAVLDGEVVISTPAARPKARNARADSRVSFIVDTKERPYRGVAIEGDAVVSDDVGQQMMRAIARRYLGDPLPEAMEDRIASGARVALRITARRVRPWNLEAS
jgi:PPOX class probable F420-dependent enzyme